MQSVTPVGIETNDILDFVTNPTAVDFSLRVGAGWEDGFSLMPVAGSVVCLDLSSPVATDIHFGPARTLLVAPFELEALAICDPQAP